METEQNERVQEWFLIVGDWFRDTPNRWFYAFVGLLVIAIPMYMFLSLVFERALVAAISPIPITYTEVVKDPLLVSETKIFHLSNGTYYGYARIKNPNSEWGVPKQSYAAEFKDGAGQVVMTFKGEVFVLPSQEKVLVFARFQTETAPTSITINLGTSEFIRPPSLPSLNLELQRRNISVQGGQTNVTAVIVNRTPFTITQVDLPVLLYDSNGQIVAANYTNINDLTSAESRSFQYVWFGQISNAVRAEIIPEINVYNRDIFKAAPSTDPFDSRD